MSTIEIDDTTRETLQQIQAITGMDESALLKGIIHNELIAWRRALNIAERQTRAPRMTSRQPDGQETQ